MTDSSPEGVLPSRAKIEACSYRSRTFSPTAVSVTVEMPDESFVVIELEEGGSVAVSAHDSEGDDLCPMTSFEAYDGGWETPHAR